MMYPLWASTPMEAGKPEANKTESLTPWSLHSAPLLYSLNKWRDEWMIEHNPWPHKRLGMSLLSKLYLLLHGKLYNSYGTTQTISINKLNDIWDSFSVVLLTYNTWSPNSDFLCQLQAFSMNQLSFAKSLNILLIGLQCSHFFRFIFSFHFCDL